MFYKTEFYTYLIDERQVSQSTVNYYKWLVKKFEVHCRGKGITSINHITKETFLKFIELLKKRNPTDKRLNDCVYTLRIYFEFLLKNGFILTSPLVNYEFKRLAKSQSPALKQEEIEESLKGNTFYQYELFDYLKKTRHSSRSTLGIYRRLVTKLEAYCRGKNILSVKSITTTIVLGFIELLKERNFAEKTFYGYIFTLKVYFEFLQQEGYIFISPMANYKFPKIIIGGRFPVLEQEEIESVLSGILRLDDDCFQGQVMLEVLYSSALRPREICNLKIQDINYEKGELFISQSKMKKDRIVPVGSKAISLLSEYINTARKKNLRPGSPDNIFLGKRSGKPHSTESVREILNHTLDHNGFGRIKPYSLRCTAATVLFLNGMGVPHINKLLGHTVFNTTKRYLRVDDLALRKQLEEKHPRFKKKGEA